MERCVLPTLIYGAESWTLSATLQQKLESFQAEIAKRILRLPKHTSNNVARMALEWPSIRAGVLIIKLCFLLRVIVNEDTLSASTFHPMWNRCSLYVSAVSSNSLSKLTTPPQFFLHQIKYQLVGSRKIS